MRSVRVFVLSGMLAGIAGCESVLEGLATGLFSDISQLMSQAEQIVEEDYPDALLIEVIGTPSSGSAEAASDIDTWEFRFVDDPGGAFPGTVFLDYANGEFGELEFVPFPLLGTVFERVPRVMSLATAVETMRDAGYTADFTGVALRKPLTFPESPEAYYIFELSDRFVFVGMTTGEVTEE